MIAPTRRRRLEVVQRAGQPHKITGHPRADVLHYPAVGLTTVLVRRTHDPAIARPLAEDRWAELVDQGLVEGDLGYGDGCVRVGWWTTHTGRLREDHQAVDDQHRVITASADTAPGAGPGIEYRP